MKLLHDVQMKKMDRKLLKPHVERRRRERMNRSLESLQQLLLQGPEHQGLTRRRVEKAEILEHTVLFLQNSSAQSKKVRDDREEKQTSLDGFSECLKRAACFLQDERGLDKALTNSVCQRLNATPRIPASMAGPTDTCPSLPGVTHPKQQQQQQCSGRKHQLCAPFRHIPTHPCRVRGSNPNVTHHHGNAQASTHPSHQMPFGQSLWRPWP